MPTKAIIFDMGNTLLHYGSLEDSWRQAEEAGIDAVYWELVGQGHFAKLERAVFAERMFTRLVEGWRRAVAGEGNLRADEWLAGGLVEFKLKVPDRLLGELIALYAAPRRARLCERPGAQATLAALRGRGLRLGLISNTMWPAVFHLADLEALGLRAHLDEATFSGEVGLWKPAPELFLHVAAALGAGAGEVVFVGDSPAEDIRGAQAAGMRAVWIFTPEFPLGTIRPDAQISRLEELPMLIEQWG